MNNFGLPPEALYNSDGAIIFPKSPQAKAQEDMIAIMSSMAQQIAVMRTQLEDLTDILQVAKKEQGILDVKAAPEESSFLDLAGPVIESSGVEDERITTE